MTKIEEAIREFFRPAFSSDKELDDYMENIILTLEFGAVDVIENRNYNPVTVKRNGMKMSTKFKDSRISPVVAYRVNE